MTDRELIHRIQRSAGQRAGYKQLVREMGLGGGRERRLLLEHLARLTASGQLIKLDREQWGLPREVTTRENLAAGKLDLHRDGYGFVRPEVRQASGNEDIFIPPNEINGAMQGDQVLVEVAPPKQDGRRMGRIVRILSRKNPTVVGIFHYGGGFSETRRGSFRGSYEPRVPGNYVTPFDDRMTQPILIAPGDEIMATAPADTPNRVLGKEAHLLLEEEEGDLEGLVVDVEITDWPTLSKPPRGRVIEVLGERDAFGVDVEIMIRKHHLPHVFPANVLAEAKAVAHLDVAEIARRRDFRELPIVTIDGETARDFDDAVLVTERNDGGYELQVHIADVSEYVREGTDLDLEARLRGTSVYFPDRAVPMLPQELSTDICSLRPNEDRLVLSCLMQIDAQGEVESYEVCKGVIRSAQRMTYTQVHAILEGDHAVRAQFALLVEDFERMKTLALLLNQKRQRRGSIDFDLPEPIIEFDQFGAMKSIVRAERNWAHRLIEEFMLSANECVASWLEDLGVPSIYRIHEKPEPRRVVEFEDVAAGFGYSLGFGALPVKRVQMKSDRRQQHGRGKNPRMHEIPEDIPVTPRMYQKLAMKIAGTPEERIVSYLMLRSLKQARYSEKNEGHFALAAPTYTHFTSPIRRYPDLIVHRIVKAVLTGVEGHGSMEKKRAWSPWTHPNEGAAPRPHARPRESFVFAHNPPIPEPELAAIAQECSQTERRADDAERELVEWKKIKFMQDRVGEDFHAMILNATKYGLFVELDDLFIEGLVPIDTLAGDRFTYNENTRQILGDRSGRRYSAGDRVRVVLDRVNAVERKLQFALLEEGGGAGSAKPSRGGKAKAKPKRKSRNEKRRSPSARGSVNRKGKPEGKRPKRRKG
ncbi:MAG TPA: VacB/RNase II family 3'-5' exoribonuclease [Acidisarcina sp.]|nr:VacB/RNase II family 3'-5' exoribonuclease [Acidisarcina sp.]